MDGADEQGEGGSMNWGDWKDVSAAWAVALLFFLALLAASL